ncbi:tlde1 domain-containing protein [Xanthobacter sp. DSM 24535]|uniref:DUF2778 domain-containing protein n=1 Tax=Roseixanthobacter psychrophilus TaxID=3119917 RepID=UPI003729DDAF
MTYTPYDDTGYIESPVSSKARLPLLVFGACLIGMGAVAAATMIVTSDAEWRTLAGISNRAVETPESAPVQAAPVQEATARAIGEKPVTDIGNFRSSGAIVLGPSWMFEAGLGTGHDRFVPRRVVVAALPPAPPLEASRSIPLPPVRPLFSPGLPSQTTLSAAPDLALPENAPLPPRNPLQQLARTQLAYLPPADRPMGEEPAPRLTPQVVPPAAQSILPGPTDRFAVYDISGKTVYMPSGERLEAHSGYGETFDDARHVSKKMVGPTPPNTYELTMRESLFHGVEALRMRPVGKEPMYGRDGFLTHSYMMGARGDSNGCISFNDYPKFLKAYKRGEVTRIIVVTNLPGMQPKQDTNPLLSWLAGRGGAVETR